MHAPRLAICALAALAVLASGCLSDDDLPPSDGGPDGAPGSTDAQPPTVLRGEGQITASGPVVAVGGTPMTFSVAPNATLLLAEIAWDDPVQDINLALASPSAGMTGTAQNFDHVAEGGSPGMPDSPHSLAVASPETGDWQASAFANGGGANVEFRIAVTLFHGETTVPEGYTAI